MPPRTSTGVWGSLERAAATVIAMASPAQRPKPHTNRFDPLEPRELQARPSSAAAANKPNAKRPKQTRATRNAPVRALPGHMIHLRVRKWAGLSVLTTTRWCGAGG
jgi:hypothetical protein